MGAARRAAENLRSSGCPFRPQDGLQAAARALAPRTPTALCVFGCLRCEGPGALDSMTHCVRCSH
eukprot:6463233-Pyramimonas_sp.AAC.1